MIKLSNTKDGSIQDICVLVRFNTLSPLQTSVLIHSTATASSTKTLICNKYSTDDRAGTVVGRKVANKHD